MSRETDSAWITQFAKVLSCVSISNSSLGALGSSTPLVICREDRREWLDRLLVGG
jgi:hypothetical protein